MKNDDLEKLETSKEIQELIRCSREAYEQEKSENSPPPFSSMMDAIHKNGTKTLRRGISPWWLTAACLLGCVLGTAFSGGIGGRQPDRLAVSDTLIVVHQRVDTVYREIQPRVQVAVASIAKSETSKQQVASNSRQKVEKEISKEPDLFYPFSLEQQVNLPNPEDEYYAANGMTVAEDNYPIHLMVSAPCK